MKQGMHLLLAALVAAVVGAGMALVSSPGRPAAAPPAAAEEQALRAELEALRTEQRALAGRIEQLASVGGSAPAPARTPVPDLDAAVAAYMKQVLQGAPDDAPGDAAGPEPSDSEAAAIAQRIVSGEVRGDELEALWQELRDGDRIDAVVAAIAHLAELEPTNPDLQSELGQAYLQKLFDVGMGPMAAAWGEKADQAFDRALELDEGHWEARFHKAISLSNWPTFLGKSGEAIRNFEILAEQQERATPRPEHAQTYYFLGNMYDQNGEKEQALATWKRGLARFPESGELRQKVEGR
jgi:tetratricopeptide (TPR) repeat protein